MREHGLRARMVGESFSEEVTLEQRPKGSERVM